MLSRVAGVLLLIAMFSASILTTNGCASPTDPEDRETTLDGRVVDATTERPIGGATVVILNAGATTNADGTFFIGGLRPATAPLGVTANGYRPFSLNVTLLSGDNHVDVRLQPR